MTKIRPIAFYLPQYHPVPENDKWWGKGFTEWQNVVKARPRYEGHYQPHLPADLGYYDLRVPEVREMQANLAKKYGIYGFCYYHYWFNGRTILERPFEEVFRSGKPDFPFMLCWANENWTKIWDGGNNEILLEQKYSREDDIAHINHLIKYFRDDRYIKVNGKPVLMIYKDALIPDVKKTIEIFRQECAKQNIELYLCKTERENGSTDISSVDNGFHAAVEFQPLSKSLNDFRKYKYTAKDINRHPGPKYLDPDLYRRYLKRLLKQLRRKSGTRYNNEIISYQEFTEFDVHNIRTELKVKLYPGVSPGFDNTPRRQSPELWAIIFDGSTPELFQQWVEGKLSKFSPFSSEENFLFINAWNEWAEGNHLEPDDKWGLKYLEALQKALQSCKEN